MQQMNKLYDDNMNNEYIIIIINDKVQVSCFTNDNSKKS